MAAGDVALITGGGTGIGKAAALALAREGYALVVTGRRQELLDATVAEIEALGARGLAVVADVGKPADVDALFAATLEAFGRLDVLFNNAGMGSPPICWRTFPTRPGSRS